MMSTRPGSDAFRVLSVFALMEEPTTDEIVKHAGVQRARVSRYVQTLRSHGYLTDSSYRIARPDMLARLGVARYATLVNQLDEDGENMSIRVVRLLVEHGPLRRARIAELLGCDYRDGALARALSGCNVTNEPSITPAGRAALETP